MNSKVKKVLCVGAIVGVVGVSGIMAYLTDTDKATNNFTVGEVKIDLTEPEWDKLTDTDNDEIPDIAENMSANQTVAKDPTVTNIGSENAYIYLKVTVPKASVITANADGTLANNGVATATPLFTYSPSNNWTEITAQKVETDTAITHVYYYNDIVAPNGSTDALFSSVTFANIIEDQIDKDTTEQIDVEAYAIQSDNLPSGTTVASAYGIYVNQNAGK